MKKLIFILLVMVMILGLVACATNKDPAANSTETTGKVETGKTEVPKIDFDEEPYTLHICYPVGAEAQADLPKIQEKLNEITLKKINAKVELEAITASKMASVYALKASGRENVDLMMLFPGFLYFSNFVNNKMIMPLDKLVADWGQDMTEILDDGLDAGYFNGELYGICQAKEFDAMGLGFAFNIQMCKDYGIDLTKIHTIDDVTAALKIAHEKDPQMPTLLPDNTMLPISAVLMNSQDMIAKFGLITKEDDGSLKVSLSVEAPEYMEAAKVVRSWYEAGYISKDVTTAQQNGSVMISNGKCFAIAINHVNAHGGQARPTPVCFVKLDSEVPLRTTSSDQGTMWAIPSWCKRPDKAMQFLNLCYADDEISNLMQWGIEGVHYEVAPDGTAKIINRNWFNPWRLFGTITKSYIEQSQFQASGANDLDELYKRYDEWNKNVKKADTYGFTFNPTKVKTQVAACEAIYNKYAIAIGDGTVNPETQIPMYIEELKAAGVQEILDEVQSQLDAWVASEK